MSSHSIQEPGRQAPPAAFAWLVHMFTGSGAVLALLALVAIEQERWHLALLWLFVAIVVDGIDGTFARWAQVKRQAPRIDGDALDLIVDYLTYVFVPTIFMWKAGLILPSMGLWLAAAIQFSSLYLFARSDMKTDDNYFRGFPALWNLIAFYLFVVEASSTTGAIVIIAFVALTFAPVHFVHPFRVRDYGRWLPLLAAIWAIATVALLWPDLQDAARLTLLSLSLGSAALMLVMGFRRSLRGPRPA